MILSLSGGGMRGYFTALVLAGLEKKLGAPCCRVFDLIAGTSVGGILAIGLAHGVPAAELAAMIDEHGPGIFPKLPFTMIRRLLGPPYKASAIERAVRAILGAKATSKLSDTAVPAMVVTVAPTVARLVVASSLDVGATCEISSLDACLATSAAPTYFPAYRVRYPGHPTGLDLVDGGIGANAPDTLAIREASDRFGCTAGQMAMLSIGTCGPRPGGPGGIQPESHGLPGTLLRLGGSGIVSLCMAVQEARGTEEAGLILGDASYLRVDGPPSVSQSGLLTLDNASKRARRTMQELAAGVVAGNGSLNSHDVWRLAVARSQTTAK